MKHWKLLSEKEYETIWDRFESEFKFQPSIYEEKWPSIVEPSPSITYSIAHCFDDTIHQDSLVDDLDSKLAQVLCSAAALGEEIYALDWHHDCFFYSPHEELQTKDRTGWTIPFLPDGDYYIHISKDLSCGIFAHPWEKTMCLFGAPVLAALSSNMPAAFSRPVRQNGGPV